MNIKYYSHIMWVELKGLSEQIFWLYKSKFSVLNLIINLRERNTKKWNFKYRYPILITKKFTSYFNFIFIIKGDMNCWCKWFLRLALIFFNFINYFIITYNYLHFILKELNFFTRNSKFLVLILFISHIKIYC